MRHPNQKLPDFDTPSPHGTARRYDLYGCRCQDCRTFNTERTRKHREAFTRSSTRKHGTNTGYNAGCRCEECAQAGRAYRAELKRRTKAASKGAS